MDQNVYIADMDEVPAIAKALNSALRRKMLILLYRNPMTVGRLAVELDIPQSTCTVNIQILEQANLLHVEKTGYKTCSTRWEEVALPIIEKTRTGERNIVETRMPVGLYVQMDVFPPCGMSSETRIIGYHDVPETFLDPHRASARMLWFSAGFVEYRFPRPRGDRCIRAVAFTVEVCSEFPGCRADWPSDITVWIGGHEAGTWTAPGDMGGLRGRFTPEWWSLDDSQYGFRKTWSVTGEGSYIDGVRSSDTTIGEVLTGAGTGLTVRIGVRDDADHRGGLNLFGRGFGNYGNDPVLRFELEAGEGHLSTPAIREIVEKT